MSDITDYQRSKANHPAGRHRRVSGCMGERSTDPRHARTGMAASATSTPSVTPRRDPSRSRRCC
jgi:hypothetical protein